MYALIFYFYLFIYSFFFVGEGVARGDLKLKTLTNFKIVVDINSML